MFCRIGFNPNEQEFVLLDKISFKKEPGGQEPEFRKNERISPLPASEPWIQDGSRSLRTRNSVFFQKPVETGTR
jgi:hypothetical protein